MMKYFASVTVFLRLVMMLEYLDTRHDSLEKHMWEAETVIWRPNTDTEAKTHTCMWVCSTWKCDTFLTKLCLIQGKIKNKPQETIVPLLPHWETKTVSNIVLITCVLIHPLSPHYELMAHWLLCSWQPVNVTQMSNRHYAALQLFPPKQEVLIGFPLNLDGVL